MPITLNDGFKVNAPRAADMRYGKLVSGKTAPYANKAEALALIPIPYRHIGLTVNIAGEEWWWKASTNDEDLIIKYSPGTVVLFTVKAPDVDAIDKVITDLAGYTFTMIRDLAIMDLGTDYIIYPGGGFAMVNPDDKFSLGQKFLLTIVGNLIII